VIPVMQSALEAQEKIYGNIHKLAVIILIPKMKKKPKPVKGLTGVYSLKRLSEFISRSLKLRNIADYV